MRAIPWNARTRRLLFVVVMLFILTFPLVNTLLTRSRVDRDGVVVDAAVAKAVDDDGRYLVAFHFPESIDPAQAAYSAIVSRATYDRARTSKRVSVRVLEGEPEHHHVQGQVFSRSPLIVTIVGDLVVLVVGLWWVRVGRRRPSVGMLAKRDVEALGNRESTSIGKDTGEVYAAVGTVTAADGSSVTIDLEDRVLVVRLNGYDNHVEVGSRGRAWGMLVG
jgi:hypothetical protein